jgi:hypothetical protein
VEPDYRRAGDVMPLTGVKCRACGKLLTSEEYLTMLHLIRSYRGNHGLDPDDTGISPEGECEWGHARGDADRVVPGSVSSTHSTGHAAVNDDD